MTREEREHVIEVLSAIPTTEPIGYHTSAEVVMAIAIVIKELEKEPCEDAVSRQAALVSIKNLYPDMPIVNIMGARQKWLEKYAPYFECENVIEHLPPVTPKKMEGKT